MTSNWLRINIFAVSSYSSQLGFLVSHACRERSSQRARIELLIAILKPSSADPSGSKRLIDHRLLRAQANANHVYVSVIPITSWLPRFFAYATLFIAWLLSPFAHVLFWQPRLHWFDRPSLRLRRRIFAVKLPTPPQVLFGDGFMQYCNTDRPFWLSGPGADGCDSPPSAFASTSVASYYHFSLLSVGPSQTQAVEVNRSFILRYFHDLLQALPVSLPLLHFLRGFRAFVAGSDASRLFVLPTSTFYETGRSTLEAEMQMYEEYLRDQRFSSDVLVAIKPHPTSSDEKLSAIRELARQFSASRLHAPNSGLMSLSHFSLVPLELLLFDLIHSSRLLDEFQIGIAMASTASLSCLRLFPRLSWSAAFGDALIDRFVEHGYAEKRLRQEHLILDCIARQSSDP